MTTRGLRRRSALATLGLLPVLPRAFAQAQGFPNRPLRWLVASPPGGAADGMARLVANQLAKQIGQPVVVENKVGAAGIISAQAAIQAPHDGYTLLAANNSLLVYNQALFRKLPYDPLKDLAPVSLTTRIPLLVLASKDSQFSSMQQVVDYARKNPGKLSYASPGVGTGHHLAFEALKAQARLDIVTVQYNGFVKAFQDMMANRIEIAVLDSASASAQLAAGNLRPLATFSKARMPSLPNVPSLIELGLMDVEPVVWQSVVVAAGTPRDIQDKLNTEVRAALANAELQARIREMGAEPAPTTVAEMQRYVEAESRYWVPLIRSLGITTD